MTNQQLISDAQAEIRLKSHNRDYMQGVKARAKGESFRDGTTSGWKEGWAAQHYLIKLEEENEQRLNSNKQ